MLLHERIAMILSARDAGRAVPEGGDEFGGRLLEISVFLDVAAQVFDGALDAGRHIIEELDGSSGTETARRTRKCR